MGSSNLFIVRAKSKRNRIIHFLADFNSLVAHKHLDVVQYLDKTTHKWIDFSDITKGTVLEQNFNDIYLPLNKLGEYVYYGLEIQYIVKNRRTGKILYNKISEGNPTEYYRYMKQKIVRDAAISSRSLVYNAIILDTKNWYEIRQIHAKRKCDYLRQFTLIHV